MEGVEPHLQNLVPYLIQTLDDPKVDKLISILETAFDEQFFI
jgi:hypothetical protein